MRVEYAPPLTHGVTQLMAVGDTPTTLTALGTTVIAIGTGWLVYMLSPKNRYLWTGAASLFAYLALTRTKTA